MDFTSDKGNWIRSFKDSGGPKKSDDQSASISQHGSDDGAAFSWDFSNAKGGNSVNPLLSAAASGSGGTVAATGTSSCVPRPTTGTFASGSGSAAAATATSSSWPSTAPSQYSTSWPTEYPSQWRTHWPTASPTGAPFLHSGFPFVNPSGTGSPFLLERQDINYCDSSSSSQNGITPINTGRTTQQKMLIAHGTLAALAFVVFFPAGAISIRLASFPGILWFHAAFQIFSYLTFMAAFGLGVHLANEFDLVSILRFL